MPWWLEVCNAAISACGERWRSTLRLLRGLQGEQWRNDGCGWTKRSILNLCKTHVNYSYLNSFEVCFFRCVLGLFFQVTVHSQVTVTSETWISVSVEPGHCGSFVSLCLLNCLNPALHGSQELWSLLTPRSAQRRKLVNGKWPFGWWKNWWNINYFLIL